MFEKVMILISLIFLFIGIVSVFMARDIVKGRVEIGVENKMVRGVKAFGFIVSLVSLVAIYFFVR